ncbi:MAG TPA: BLUF domain-containing protein [Methylotenera sp.]
MQKLVQIIYISRSTFENTDAVNKIEPNVVRILAKSRTNNRRNGLVGVLYFGDGAFFQCLEGDEDTVNTLFAKIEKDPRHKDVRLISKKHVSRLSFPDWAMKYALLDEKMGKFLKENGYQSFDPYVFRPEMTQKILNLLVDADDPIIEIEPAYPNASLQIASKSSNAKNLNVLSLFISITACALAAAALLSVRGFI